MIEITDIKDLIKEKNLKLADFRDQYDLKDTLDYDGSLHSIIDSYIDIYNYDLRKWAAEHYDEIEEGFAHPRQSGVLFVFVDEDGFGVYRLVHSTAVGEIQNLRSYDSITLESGFDR